MAISLMRSSLFGWPGGGRSDYGAVETGVNLLSVATADRRLRWGGFMFDMGPARHLGARFRGRRTSTAAGRASSVERLVASACLSNALLSYDV